MFNTKVNSFPLLF